MILVTGATGNVGGELIRILCAADAATRALVRSPEKADALRGYDCELATGNFDDPPSIVAALRGVDALFLASPAGPRQVELESTVLEVAQRAGVRIVKLAIIGWDAGGMGRIADSHARIIERLAATGLRYTVLAPNDYMQTLLVQAATVQEAGVLALPHGDGAVSSVDARDVAAVAAHVLGSDAHDGASYIVTGPESLTRQQVAERLARLLGKDVHYVAAEPAQAKQGMIAAGMDEWMVDGLLELAIGYRDGRGARVTDEVRKATGHDARPWQQFLADHRAAFA